MNDQSAYNVVQIEIEHILGILVTTLGLLAALGAALVGWSSLSVLAK